MLDKAKKITEEVTSIFKEMEELYRYPVELLARKKTESLTSYKFGYLYETSTGFFWKRRDEQLESLIGIRFETVEEKWKNEPDTVFISNKDMISMTEPKNRIAACIIKSFIPH